MSLIEAFAEYLENVAVAQRGVDLFTRRAPVQPDALWWLKSYGGTPTTRLDTGEMVKTYYIQAFYRDRDAQAVEDKLFALEEQLNGRNAGTLPGFNTVEIQAFTFPTDNDLDDEDRQVGLLQANITIYKE